jgi:hypothetical protein
MHLSAEVFAVPVTQVALLKNIPMPLLSETVAKLKARGISYKIRYRGPRATAPNDRRSRRAKASDCLKENANRFSVYAK